MMSFEAKKIVKQISGSLTNKNDSIRNIFKLQKEI